MHNFMCGENAEKKSVWLDLFARVANGETFALVKMVFVALRNDARVKG